MLYRQVANAFSHRFLTFFFFILMPDRKVRPSFFLQTFSGLFLFFISFLEFNHNFFNSPSHFAHIFPVY